MKRQDVTLEVDFYSSFRGTFTARLKGRYGETLEIVKGALGEPTSANPSAGSDLIYPLYEVTEAHGIVDIVEHRAMTPTMYMTDDPTIWAKLVGAGKAQH